MGLLVGLPLKIFYLLFTVLRFAWPLLLALLVYLIRRKLRNRVAPAQNRKDQDFDGPVVEVDYQVVDEKEE
jgi:membrane protein implicated in regulation of membrane protease activity